MAINDYDGTSYHEIGKVYDYNGTTYSQIGKVYDNNGTTSSLIYSAEEQIYPGTSATERTYSQNVAAGTFYAVANPHTAAASGCCAYIYIGANSYGTITYTVKLTSVPVYGWIGFGFGDFPTYNLAGHGPAISWGYSGIQTSVSGYYNGQQISISTTGAESAGKYFGVYAAYRSSAGTGGRIDVVSIIAK